MFPGNFVQSTPDKPAVIRPATGESITYRELDERSTQLARYFRSVGAKPGDTSLSSRTTISGRRGVLGSVEIRPLHHRGELASHGFGGCYIVDDCEATILVASGQRPQQFRWTRS